MKYILLLGLILIANLSFASKNDSTFQRHQISFSMTNAVSQEFFNGPKSATTREIIGDWFSSNILYKPNYALHLRLDYSVALSKILRFETGIGYLIEGETISGAYSGETMISYNTKFDYTGVLTVPLHIKYSKNIKKGTFTCTLGPNFNFPIHYFGKQINNRDGGYTVPNSTYHGLESTIFLSSLGVDLKLGYQTKLSKNSVVDFGPIINFTDLAFFDKEANQELKKEQYKPYQYYIGFDVAFIFDVKKKK